MGGSGAREMLGPGLGEGGPTADGPQDPSPRSLTFAHGEGRSPGTGGGGFAGCGGGGGGPASRLTERTRQWLPGPWFCGAFQEERSLFSSRGGGTGGGQEGGGAGLYKGTAPASAGFFPLKGAGGALASNCRRGSAERPPPKGEARRRRLGGDSAARTRSLPRPPRT